MPHNPIPADDKHAAPPHPPANRLSRCADRLADILSVASCAASVAFIASFWRSGGPLLPAGLAGVAGMLLARRLPDLADWLEQLP